MFRTILPSVNLVIIPCDPHGLPAMNEEQEKAAHHETGAWLLAWFGRCLVLPFGEVEPRMIDPSNPRQYAPGNMN